MKPMAQIVHDAESVARAKAYMHSERAKITAATGVRFNGDRMVRPAFIIHCRQSGCRHSCSARTEGRAINAIAAHIVKAHLKKES